MPEAMPADATADPDADDAPKRLLVDCLGDLFEP